MAGDGNFVNCMCCMHDWFLCGAYSGVPPRWREGDLSSTRVQFLVECEHTLYMVPVRIHRSTGTLQILSIRRSKNAAILPGFCLPLGSFLEARLDACMKAWDRLHPTKPRIPLAATMMPAGLAVAGPPFPANPERETYETDSSVEEVDGSQAGTGGGSETMTEAV